MQPVGQTTHTCPNCNYMYTVGQYYVGIPTPVNFTQPMYQPFQLSQHNTTNELTSSMSHISLHPKKNTSSIDYSYSNKKYGNSYRQSFKYDHRRDVKSRFTKSRSLDSYRSQKEVNKLPHENKKEEDMSLHVSSASQ